MPQKSDFVFHEGIPFLYAGVEENWELYDDGDTTATLTLDDTAPRFHFEHEGTGSDNFFPGARRTTVVDKSFEIEFLNVSFTFNSEENNLTFGLTTRLTPRFWTKNTADSDGERNFYYNTAEGQTAGEDDFSYKAADDTVTRVTFSAVDWSATHDFLFGFDGTDECFLTIDGTEVARISGVDNDDYYPAMTVENDQNTDLGETVDVDDIVEY